MRMSSEPSREEIDRLRGLARAAWARLQRDDLDDEQSASAQEEYARTRDELLDLGIGIEVTEQQSLTFVEEEEIVEDYDPELLVESIDGSMDPVPLRSLTRIVDLAGFLKAPVCAAIGKWAIRGVPKDDNRFWSLCGMAEREPRSKLCVQHNNKFPVNNPHRVPPERRRPWCSGLLLAAPWR